MQTIQKIKEDVFYVGASDRRLNLFENIFPIPHGMSYNSYVILDKKTALLDTADYSVSEVFVENVKAALGDKELDYIVVDHMEPDHASSLSLVLHEYPNATLVATAKALQMVKQFFGDGLTDKVISVKEGDTLELGKHTLQFYMAPMVHWPEVMVTYDVTDKALYSADAFGTFGALSGNLYNDDYKIEEEWIDDYRRYYTNICGKYGMPVQTLLKKAANLDIQMICPLHGPIWRNNLGYILNKYDLWSRYEPEEKAVVIAYASIYGHTENAVHVLMQKLNDRGIQNIVAYDVSNTDISYLTSEMFRCSHIVLASSTYNLGIFPKMENLIADMKALTVQNRKVSVFDNGTWAPAAGKKIIAELETMKSMERIGETFTIKSALHAEDLPKVEALADAIAESLKA